MSGDYIAQFTEAIRAAGLEPPDTIKADGKLHRFSSNGKRGDDAGWYVLHFDHVPAGAFGCWRESISETWRANVGRSLTPEEESRLRQTINRIRRQQEEEKRARRQESASKADALWNGAEEARPDHPYLTRKGVKPHGIRQKGDTLIVPVRIGGRLSSLQFIAANGEKRFLTGGEIKGGYFLIGSTEGAAALLVAEGYATAATLHEATGFPVAVAFNAGNLEPVAKMLRRQHPSLPLIVCADDDSRTRGNPGVTHATAAALAVGGKLAVPNFGDGRPEGVSDFNDLAALHGIEAVRQAIAAAKPVRPAPSEQAQAVLIRASELKPEPVHWLWHGWLAAGKLHILAGAPGCGKTTIAMALAATISCGGRWPDGSRATPGNVVVWSGEDDPADTLVPRLILSGGDPDRVLFVRDVQDGGERRPFDPGKDIELLRQGIAEIGNVRLLIIDPVVSAVIGDSHKNGEVRRSLQPLVDLAASCRCAVLGISHFSKGSGGRDPVERVVGSLAFGALARIVIAAGKTKGEDGSERRILCRSKSNIGQDDGGYEYSLMAGEPIPGLTATAVTWGRTIEGSARELLADPDEDGDTGDGSSMADAKQFLRDLLADGPMRAGDIFREAEQAGYAKRTIQRAANALKIDRRKDGMKGGWTWRLAPEGAKPPLEDAVGANKKSLASTAPSASSLAPSTMVEIEL